MILIRQTPRVDLGSRISMACVSMGFILVSAFVSVLVPSYIGFSDPNVDAVLVEPRGRVDGPGHVSKTYTHVNPQHELSSKNIGNEIIYQIFVDRFANGNPDNDCIHEGRFCAQGGHEDWYRYQGGDIRGIVNHMSYLKDLGVTRVWLSPIVENQQVTVRTRKFGRDVEVSSYHGYWFKDWYRLNPYFTDRGETDYEIIDEMIEAGLPEIRFYLDTVANHTSPADATSWSLDYLNELQPLDLGVRFPHRGALFREGEFVASFDHDRELARQIRGFVPRFHLIDRPIRNWNDPYEVLYYQLDRLVDLSQSSPEIQEYLWDAHVFWMDRFPDLAGYRIDTIKHVPQNYWEHFSDQLYERFPKMEAFGEYWAAGSVFPESYPFYLNTRFSMLDFNFRSVLERIFGTESASFNILTAYWSYDRNLGDARQLVTFLDSHDVPRLRGTTFSYKRMKQASALWMTSRGIPVIYYGLEQDLYFPGDPGDPFNRPMMEFDRNSEMFQHMQRLIQLRRSNEALRYGETHVVHETRHIIGYERIYNDQYVFFATSKNPREGADEFAMRNLKMPDGTYQDILTGSTYQVREGQIEISLKRGDIILLSNIPLQD